jgi:cyclase
MQQTPRAFLGLAFAGLLAAAWTFGPRSAAEPQQEVDVVAHPVAGTVSWLEGSGGNIGVCAGADGIVMVDDQFENLAPKIQAALDSLSKGPLRFVLNTHFHGDHTGGNAVFGRKAPIVAHENVRQRLTQPRTRNGRTEPASPPEALPVLTYADSVSLHLNGEDIVVLHVPHCHTDGDSVVWFKQSNVVHLGDLFFSGRFPFVDLDSGGSVKGLIEGLTALKSKLPADAKLIPGHGPLSTREDLDKYLAMLVATRTLVADGLAAGKKPEDLKREKVLAGFDSWSWAFVDSDKFLDVLIRDAGAK